MNKSLLTRYLIAPVQTDLKEKMVFLDGPRQVGKTTFAFSFLKTKSLRYLGYLNWDDVSNRSALLKGELPGDQ